MYLTNLILLQRIAGDGSERWQWWFWGVAILLVVGLAALRIAMLIRSFNGD